MNNDRVTDLLESVRNYHYLAVQRAEENIHASVQLYNTLLNNAIKELIVLGDSKVGYAANTVQVDHFRVIDDIVFNKTICKGFNQHNFEESMSLLERAVNNFKKESVECAYGQPVCPDCSTDIEDCPCQDEVVMGKDGKVKVTNEELDRRTPTMLWLDITNAAHKDVVGKDGKLNTGATADSDVVNNPSHYQLFPGVEAIEVIAKSLTAEEFRGYCLGNKLKYLLRAGKKDKAEQDLSKADKYIELYNKYK